MVTKRSNLKNPWFPTTRNNSLLLLPQQVPQQSGSSALEVDARQEAAALVKRVESAAKRAFRQRGVVAKLRKLLGDDKAEHTHAVDEAVECEQAAIFASADLELARTQERAAKRRCDKSSSLHGVFRSILAMWEADPQSDMEEAARLVDKMGRAHSLARAEADAAWGVVHRCEQIEEATEFFLRKAEDDHARAVHIFHALEAAAARAENRAAYAASAVEMGRFCWEKNASARGRGGEMDPLLFAAALATSLEDGFNKHQVWDTVCSPTQHTRAVKKKCVAYFLLYAWLVLLLYQVYCCKEQSFLKF